MQFVTNGPEVPERLVRAHEDGRVVFFCGAGISYPAGLPGFAGLVARLRAAAPVEDAAIDAAVRDRQYDRAIGLLEERAVGGREAVRKELAEILAPDLDRPGATATHEALLTLGRERGSGRARLVTTNFDRLFEAAIGAGDLDVERFAAPLLPPPKRSWSGLAYLHGLLPAEPDPGALDRLVVSSGDFGLAYLNDGWAARFVGGLFRNFTVCFVGYSLEDPVLRYMTDALAADRLMGEASREMFAFAGHPEGGGDAAVAEWRAKNVTPVPYPETGGHARLHETLREWARVYAEGIAGKERIVAEHAHRNPSGSTAEDNFVGRTMWALSDPSGAPARRFAELDPVPSLAWLGPLFEDRYGAADLARFGVAPGEREDDKLAFGLLRRPTPHALAPRMGLTVEHAANGGWDDRMRFLAWWLTRHLDDPKLVLWLAARGGALHPNFAEAVERRLRELRSLEREGKTDELERIRANAPHAIPRPAMRKLWDLLLAGRVGPEMSMTHAMYDWLERLDRDGPTPGSRLKLRALLAPRVLLRPPWDWDIGEERAADTGRIDDLVDWEMALSLKDAHSAFGNAKSENGHWRSVLPELLDDFHMLLRDLMDLFRELGGADDREDRSCFDQPSISEHEQNRRFHDWTALIDLARDAWLETARTDPDRARRVAEAWSCAPYPVFRRLAFFAAAQDDGPIPPRQGLDWLLTDEHWWLWFVETQREAMRLLAALAPKLDAESRAELESAILAGPPGEMFEPSADPDHLAEEIDRDIWLRLGGLEKSGAALGPAARDRLEAIRTRHPDWPRCPEERDEFPMWFGPVEVGVRSSASMRTPRRRPELAAWLRDRPEPDDFREDDWPRRCKDDFPTAACALCALAREGVWPAGRWTQALRVWCRGNQAARSWRYMSPALLEAPADALGSFAPALSRWLAAAAKLPALDEPRFFDLCRRVLAASEEEDADETDRDPLNTAIDRPAGIVTEALLVLRGRTPPEDGQGLPADLAPIFTELCDTEVRRFRHGRVVLASRAQFLFRVDRPWTEKHLLPLFDWDRDNAEARGAWSGFLWSPRLERSSLTAIKEPFLETSHHYDGLGTFRSNYVRLLTFAALEFDDLFDESELRGATANLPENGLLEAARAVGDALKAAGDRRAEYWRNRVSPYFRKVWPQAAARRTPAVSGRLARLCIEAGDAFPLAVEELRYWLGSRENYSSLGHFLVDSGLCERFPDAALDFLDRTIGDETQYLYKLADCLRQILAAKPELEHDRQYRDLRERLRRNGLLP